MKLKTLFNTTFKKVIAILLVLLTVVAVFVLLTNPDLFFGLLVPFLWAVLVVGLSWIAIHYGIKAWRKRKRTEFDEAVAAKEGIEDRKQEWAQWTDELEKQGIDRYELPFYLLVGEPQSGKSVLLRNSDLHFPFGQNRLSGVGGTRGCDWWFTEEAVILDLAGRLFTHEGGAADRVEFEAFLKLLYEFRPMCPANGVILVLPCDSLIQDSEEECALKATKIQTALASLTEHLQAQLPVYLVLTKGDQIFGFAESVHRLEVEQRHQMFGWSRPADKIDAPFDMLEVLQGVDSMVERARLLRSHMMAGARLPEAIPEVDRMYAFPLELDGLKANLEEYLKRIFTSSSITDRVFFRGLYLTSGLQAGVPLAKVSAELFGQAGEADMRDLEALFKKPRAYFIKDLIRQRVFGERGLVRPTQGRMKQTQRLSVVGYGIAGAILLASIATSAIYLSQDNENETFALAIAESEKALQEDPPANKEDHVRDVLYRLQCLADAAAEDVGRMEETFSGPREDFEGLYRAVFDAEFLPVLKELALSRVHDDLRAGLEDAEHLDRTCGALLALMRGTDFSEGGTVEAILEALPPYASVRATAAGREPLNLVRAFELRDDFGGDDGLFLPLSREDEALIPGLVEEAAQAVATSFDPDSNLRPENELGYLLAWRSAEKSREELGLARDTFRAIGPAHNFARAIGDMRRITSKLPGGTSGRKLLFGSMLVQLKGRGVGYLDPFVAYLDEKKVPHSLPAPDNWVIAPGAFAQDKMQELAASDGIGFSSLGLHFGAGDAGRTLFGMTEGLVKGIQDYIVIGEDGFPVGETLDQPEGLVRMCEAALPDNLEPGSLEGLSGRFSRVEQILENTSNDFLENVFRGQVVELSRRMAGELFELSDARAAFLGADDEAGPIPVAFVSELTSLHRTTGELHERENWGGITRNEIERLQESLERHLNNQLNDSAAPDEWMPALTSNGELSSDAWSFLDEIGKVRDLQQVEAQKYRIHDAAKRVQLRGFLHRAEELRESWASRKSDDLSLTEKTVRELRELAQGAQVNLSGGGLSSEPEFRTWSREVDAMLKSRLEDLESKIGRIWRANIPEGGGLSTVVKRAESALETVGNKIELSESQGLSALTAILDQLKVNEAVLTWLELPASRALLDTLRSWRIPSAAVQVEAHPEFEHLENALSELSIAAEDPTALAEYFKRDWVSYQREPDDSLDAGVRMVRAIRADMHERIVREIREEFLDDLRRTLEADKYETLVATLFWSPEDEADDWDIDNKELERDLDGLFKEGRGDLDRLEKSYSLYGEESIAALIFAPVTGREAEEEDDWTQFYRFLADLQTFLLEGDTDANSGGRSVRGSEIDFTLESDVRSGSLWDLPGIDTDQRRSWFYYPADDSSRKMEKVGVSSMQEVKIRGWGFATGKDDRAMKLVWANPVTWDAAKSSSDNFTAEAPGCLAPLLWAWSGRPLLDERTEFMVTLRPKGTTLDADVKFRFESPIPLRPEAYP